MKETNTASQIKPNVGRIATTHGAPHTLSFDYLQIELAALQGEYGEGTPMEICHISDGIQSIEANMRILGRHYPLIGGELLASYRALLSRLRREHESLSAFSDNELLNK